MVMQMNSPPFAVLAFVSSDNLFYARIGVSGTILAESKSVEANPSKNKTDITSVTFIGLNTTPQQHQLLMDSLIAGYKAIQKGQIPSIQFPASSTYPQYSQQQLPIGQYGQSPVIIMQAPSSPFCVNPATGAWYNQVGMPPASKLLANVTLARDNRKKLFRFSFPDIYGVPPYGLPPMQPPPGQPTMGKYQGQMPTSLATVWEIIAKLKEDTAQLERAVSDASSSARPNSYDPNNANVFNVPIPYSASIY